MTDGMDNGQPTFEGPDEDCNCFDSAEVILEAEDKDMTLDLLIDVMTPRTVTIAMTFEVQGELHALQSLAKQYRALKDVPASESTRREIVEEIKDAIETLNQFESLVADGLGTTISAILEQNPTIEVRSIDD